jgi:hypothetical protein
MGFRIDEDQLHLCVTLGTHVAGGFVPDSVGMPW